MMRNSTKVKEFEILFNGKNMTKNELLVRPLECILGACKMDVVEESNIPTTSKPWSDKATWGGVLPVDGDEVEIKPDMWVELDLAETPRLKKLSVNGRLSFKDDKANLPHIHLKAFLIWVRAGELLVGTAAKPFEAKVTIETLGHTESDTLTLGGTVKAGNKVMVSNNRVEMFGKKRTRMTRMTDSAESGAETIKVDSTVALFDWAVGDYLFIATSTIHATHSEYRTIKAITGGVITLDKPLEFYHYGTAESTAAKYNGVDIRNEVALLSSNVMFKGEEKDGWAGHVLVSDLIDAGADGAVKMRRGYLIADNVEFFNVSQKDVGKGGLRWESAVGSDKVVSTVTNCAIHSGLDWGISI